MVSLMYVSTVVYKSRSETKMESSRKWQPPAQSSESKILINTPSVWCQQVRWPWDWPPSAAAAVPSTGEPPPVAGERPCWPRDVSDRRGHVRPMAGMLAVRGGVCRRGRCHPRDRRTPPPPGRHARGRRTPLTDCQMPDTPALCQRWLLCQFLSDFCPVLIIFSLHKFFIKIYLSKFWLLLVKLYKSQVTRKYCCKWWGPWIHGFSRSTYKRIRDKF